MALTDGRIIHYHFNSDLLDSSGNGNDGTAQGSLTYDTATPILGSASVQGNGTDAYVTLPSSPVNLGVGADCTFYIWVRPSTDALQSIISMRDVSDSNQLNWLFIGDGTGSLTDELITIARNQGSGAANEIRVGYTTSNRSELFDGDKHLIIVKYEYDVGFQIKLDNSSKAITVGSGSDNGRWGGLTGIDEALLMSFAGGFLLKNVADEFIMYDRKTTDAEDTEFWNGGAGLEVVVTPFTLRSKFSKVVQSDSIVTINKSDSISRIVKSSSTNKIVP